MAAEGLSIREFKILYNRKGDKDDLLRNIYETAFGFSQRRDQFLEKKNKCPWLKIGKHGFCGKPCKDVLCHKHMLKSAAGARFPLPCLFCGVGVKNTKPICKSCRLGETARRRNFLLAKEFEDDWGAEPSIGSYAWHAQRSDENGNASGN